MIRLRQKRRNQVLFLRVATVAIHSVFVKDVMLYNKNDVEENGDI